MADDYFMYEPLKQWEEDLFEARALSSGMLGHFNTAKRIAELVRSGNNSRLIHEALEGATPFGDLEITVRVYLDLLEEFPAFGDWQKLGISGLLKELHSRFVTTGKSIYPQLTEMIEFIRLMEEYSQRRKDTGEPIC